MTLLYVTIFVMHSNSKMNLPTTSAAWFTASTLADETFGQPKKSRHPLPTKTRRALSYAY
jgi:hypothetical protein